MSNKYKQSPKPVAQFSVAKLDAWVSAQTGAGQAGIDLQASYTASTSIMAATSARTTYQASPLAKVIVDAPTEEATRAGFTLEIPSDAKLAKTIQTNMESIHGPAMIAEALRKSRLFGGSIIYMVTSDFDISQPLRMPAKVLGLHVFAAGIEATSTSEYVADITSPSYGLPAYYRIQSLLPGISVNFPRVHHSRVIRFSQYTTDLQSLLLRQGFGPSCLEGLTQSVQSYESAHDSAATLMYDFSAGVFTMPGLRNAMAEVTETDSSGLDLVTQRLRALDRFRSVHKSVVLDGGDGQTPPETFQRVTTPLSGMPEILDRLAQRVSMVSRIPLSILFGTGTAGMLNDGTQSTLAYQAFIQTIQTTQLRPAIEHLATVLFGRAEPSEWSVVFAPLSVPTRKEQADTNLTQANADAVYLDRGCVSIDEIRQSRFGAKPSMNTTVDLTVTPETLGATE